MTSAVEVLGTIGLAVGEAHHRPTKMDLACGYDNPGDVVTSAASSLHNRRDSSSTHLLTNPYPSLNLILLKFPNISPP